MKIRVNLWRNSLGALSAGSLTVIFCVILLWHNPLIFWNDDYELSILPVFADVARSWSEGHWPILSPYSWVCGNLAGEFQYGTFSVFVNAAGGQVRRHAEIGFRQFLDADIAEILAQQGRDLLAAHQRDQREGVVGQRIGVDEGRAHALGEFLDRLEPEEAGEGLVRFEKPSVAGRAIDPDRRERGCRLNCELTTRLRT